ncbi:trypsin-like peptidase domain-containing protein [Amycolatopsis acidicola]|uniref:Trypsin-like peptidase domain-containing protein n=1 Tax=Amycolatopsis acidicola TaxID=2596893 RepID=A0A5N0V393_9PSEU|nr:serine protease [Amycolatopsis acidicola]KAA9160909.1 trypsin-like peptidase domain-containing protein [Amycolatopsis acidicola]
MSAEGGFLLGRPDDPDTWRARVHDREGRILGAGVLLAGGAVLTCAHVIAAAVGDPLETELSVHPIGLPGVPSMPARVLPGCWAPPDKDDGADVAVLGLDGHNLAGLPGASLRELARPRRRKVRMYGFPDSHDNGIEATAVVSARSGPDGQWFQLNVVENGSLLRKGFSGAGVVDERTGAVIGMLVAAYRAPQDQVAWMIPVNTLAEHVPALGKWVGAPVPARRWEPSIGVIVIVQALAGGPGLVVDAAGKSVDEVSRVVQESEHAGSFGLAGLESASDPREVLDGVVEPLVRSGARVVLQLDDEDSPAARLARRRQREALRARVGALGHGVAELAEREAIARDNRTRIAARLSPAPELPGIPALAAPLQFSLPALESIVDDHDSVRMHRRLRHYEKKLERALDTVDNLDDENDEAMLEHERLHGLLVAYDARSVQHGLMEDEELGALFRAAHAALEAEPCVLSVAAGHVRAYVEAVREKVAGAR